MYPARRRSQPQEPTSGSSGGEVTASAGRTSEDPRIASARDGGSLPVTAQSWRIIGCSVQGASHIRKGLENQDAIRWKSGDGQRVILSVADGHGSPRSFRSATGAKFAVDVSLDLASELLEPGHLDLSFVKDRLEQDVPRRVVRDWQARVDADLVQSPLTESELIHLEEQAGRESIEYVEQNPHLAYGSTLLTTIATESFAAFWQIGDGDLLTVSASGRVGRLIPEDESLVGDETRSLCSPDAWQLFRVAVLGTPAPMILLSTDGFSNSFQDDEGFFKFGSDVREMIIAEGLEEVNSKLAGWLRQITELGSGDDISLGIVCRPSALQPPSSGPPDSHETPPEGSEVKNESLLERPQEKGETGNAADQTVSPNDRDTLILSEQKASFLVRVLMSFSTALGALGRFFRRESLGGAAKVDDGKADPGTTDTG